MGRINAYGYRFLVKRPDSSSFTYVREITQKLSRHVSGEITSPWSGVSRPIGGRQIIKLSLETGDIEMAASRWRDLHGQIELLLARAKKQVILGANTAQVRPIRISTLDADQIRTLGDRYYHDILAAEDRIVLNIEKRVERVRSELDHARADDSPSISQIKKAEIEYHREERSTAAICLETDDFRCFDLNHYMNKKGEWFDDTNRPKKDDIYYIEDSKLESVLNENGLDLPVGHPSRLPLAQELCRQKVRAHEDIIARKKGNHTVLTPVPPVLVVPELVQKEAGPKLSAVFETWKIDRRAADRTKAEFCLYVSRFIALFGDLPVKDITRTEIKRFRDAMSSFPRDVPSDKKNLSTAALIGWAKRNPKIQTLAITTINDRAIGALSAVLSVAVDDDLISFNPCRDVKYKLKVGDVQKRPPYSIADLRVIFQSTIYSQGLRPKGGGEEAAYWLPLLGLYTGARLEEIAQLRVEDVKMERFKDQDIHFLDLAEMNNELESATKRKTESSRRYIPIHDLLINRRFLEYVEQMRGMKHIRLFPKLTEYKGKRSAVWSKWWGRYARIQFAKEQKRNPSFRNNPRTVFHSFRHSFADACRGASLDHVIIQDLMGHTSGGTTGKYGNGYALEQLKAQINRVDYGGINFE